MGKEGPAGINLAPRAPGAKTEREFDARDLGGLTRRPHMCKPHTLAHLNEFTHLRQLQRDWGGERLRSVKSTLPSESLGVSWMVGATLVEGGALMTYTAQPNSEDGDLIAIRQRGERLFSCARLNEILRLTLQQRRQ